MGDLVVTILLLVGIVAVTTVLFGGWMIMSLFRGAWRLIDRGSAVSSVSSQTGRHCDNTGCRMINPPHARFCRRCGADLTHVAETVIQRDPPPLRIGNVRSKIAS